MNTLYVFDELADYEHLINSFKADNSQKKLVLCPLTTDYDFISSLTLRLQQEKWDIHVENFTEIFNKTAFSIREHYLRFIAEFPEEQRFSGKNLKEYFKFPSKNFSGWWFSSIAEKNTLKSGSYHRLAKFLAILEIQKTHSCGYVWYDTDDRALYEVLKVQGKIKGFKCRNLKKNKTVRLRLPILLQVLLNSVVFLGLYLIKIFIIKIRMNGLNDRKTVLKKSRFLLVTYFPLADRGHLMQRKFVNRYYQPLQKALEKKYRDEFIWLGMIVNIERFNWNESAKLGKKLNEWGYPLYFCEDWFAFRDLFLVFFEYAFIALRFFVKLSQISREFRYRDLNIWQLFKKDWYESFCGSNLIHAIVHYHLFNNLFGELNKTTAVTYLYEMQPWEKALNLAAAERNVQEVIGIQHTSVPLLLLNYFNNLAELEYRGMVQTVPRPGYLATVGEIPRKLFLDSGWDKKKVFVLGAIRLQQFKRYLEKEIPWSSRENIVTVALAIGLEESKELLSYVHQAFRGSKYRIMLKGHPALSVQSIIDSSNIHLDSAIFTVVDAPLYEILPVSKALIVTGSSASLEGIASQCPVIIPRLVSVIDMNPFSGISTLPLYVNSPGELRRATDGIMNMTDSPLDYEECKRFIESYFEFLGSDDEFLERIENLKKKT